MYLYLVKTPMSTGVYTGALAFVFYICLYLCVFVFGENTDVTRGVHWGSGHPLPGLPYALLRLHTQGPLN